MLLLEGGLKYMNVIDPKKIPTARIWELQVPKALERPSVERMRRILVKMKAYEMMTASVGARVLIPPIINNSISLIWVLEQDRVNKGRMSQK